MILVELIWKMALVDSQQVLGSIQMLFSGHSSEVKQDSQDSRLELFFQVVVVVVVMEMISVDLEVAQEGLAMPKEGSQEMPSSHLALRNDKYKYWSVAEIPCSY